MDRNARQEKLKRGYAFDCACQVKIGLPYSVIHILQLKRNFGLHRMTSTLFYFTTPEQACTEDYPTLVSGKLPGAISPSNMQKLGNSLSR